MIKIDKIKIFHKLKNDMIENTYNIDYVVSEYDKIGKNIWIKDTKKIVEDIKNKLTLCGLFEIEPHIHIGDKANIFCIGYHICNRYDFRIYAIQSLLE